MTSPESFPVEDARKKFADILDGTQFRSTHAQITRRGKRAGYVVPPEWYDRAVEALAQDQGTPPAMAQQPESTPTPSQKAAPTTKPRRRPEPRDGRPLTDEEAKTLATTALERASEMQGQKLRQITANAAPGYEDYAIVSSALDLGLLTHDEVYGDPAPERPVGSEEKTT